MVDRLVFEWPIAVAGIPVLSTPNWEVRGGEREGVDAFAVKRELPWSKNAQRGIYTLPSLTLCRRLACICFSRYILLTIYPILYTPRFSGRRIYNTTYRTYLGMYNTVFVPIWCSGTVHSSSKIADELFYSKKLSPGLFVFMKSCLFRFWIWFYTDYVRSFRPKNNKHCFCSLHSCKILLRWVFDSFHPNTSPLAVLRPNSSWISLRSSKF